MKGNDKDKITKIGFNYKNISIIAGFSVLMILILIGTSYFAGKNQSTNEDLQENPNEATITDNMESDNLSIEDIIEGTGAVVKEGDTVSVNYVGTLTNGKEFDNSIKRGQPFEFKVGAGEVIRGWDQGLIGMKIGGKRKLTIPPSLGYGSQGVGSTIPPNSTLVFEIELLEIK